MKSMVTEAAERFNERTAIAAQHVTENGAQTGLQARRLTYNGLDVDISALDRQSGIFAVQVARTMMSRPDAQRLEVLAGALAQAFVLGALHEQIRVERERGA